MFRLNSPVMQLMARLFDLILLNLVFLLCCVPVVTIGASCTRPPHRLPEIRRWRRAAGAGDLLTAFRKNFVQATLSWLVLFAAAPLCIWTPAWPPGTGPAARPCRFCWRRLRWCCWRWGSISFPSRPGIKIPSGPTTATRFCWPSGTFSRTVLLALTVLIPLGLLLYGSTELFLLAGCPDAADGRLGDRRHPGQNLLPMFRQHENEGRN